MKKGGCQNKKHLLRYHLSPRNDKETQETGTRFQTTKTLLKKDFKKSKKKLLTNEATCDNLNKLSREQQQNKKRTLTNKQ